MYEHTTSLQFRSGRGELETGANVRCERNCCRDSDRDSPHLHCTLAAVALPWSWPT
jgi:hypothetical protein